MFCPKTSKKIQSQEMKEETFLTASKLFNVSTTEIDVQMGVEMLRCGTFETFVSGCQINCSSVKTYNKLESKFLHYPKW